MANGGGAAGRLAKAKLPALGRLTVPMIVVDDVLVALIRSWASAARDRSAPAKIIAVTGSVGKTTTKEMLRHVLEPDLAACMPLAASFNNHWGVPLTLVPHAARTPTTASSRSA